MNARHGHVDAAGRYVSQAPDGRRRPMTQERARTRGQQSGPEVRAGRQTSMSHGVDAPVKREQISTFYETVDLPVSEAWAPKLTARNDAILASRNHRNRPHRSTRASFSTSTVVNLARVGHARQRDSESVTRGSRGATKDAQPFINLDTAACTPCGETVSAEP